MIDITPQELIALQESGADPILIDVREVHEHEEFNIGGRNLPIGDIQTWKSEIPEDTDRPVVIYCQNGNRSKMAASFLENHGLDGMYNLAGGTTAWKAMEA